MFAKSRPLIRLFQETDIPILWAAYKAGSFQLGEMTQEEFLAYVVGLKEKFQKLWIIEDKNHSFKSGTGPVMMVGTNKSEFLVIAEGNPFKWSRKTNTLRACVAFLSKMMLSSKMGVCMVRGNNDNKRFLQGLKRYDVLHYVGRVAENENLFSVRGRG